MSIRLRLLWILNGVSKAKYKKLEDQLQETKRELIRYKSDDITIIKGASCYPGALRIATKTNHPYRLVISTGEFITNNHFASYDEAEEYGKKLARLNPGEVFHVYGPLSTVKAAFDILVEKTEKPLATETPPSNNQ